MLATVSSATLIGVEGRAVFVEVHVSSGLPSFTVVGLPDASCREARDRVRAAILSSGLKWPAQRVTVNLAPTGVRKGGAGLDLPIAIALLVASKQLPAGAVGETGFLGELGLDGSIRRVPGVISLVGATAVPRVVVPARCATEAQLVESRNVRAASTLSGLIDCLTGVAGWPAIEPLAEDETGRSEPDMSEVRGQAIGRLAVEVAAAGGHHLLMIGPPGAGKTMLAERLPGLLPQLESAEALEVTRIHSAAGVTLPAGALVRRPPFRAPHHSASMVSLIGGGTAQLRPGEISCAHNGVLFLDELGEFPADVLDTLRQPLEDGRVLVCRARGSVEFPARVLLVAAMNPCPCGSEGGPGSCRCREAARHRYESRISGPLLDRFDLRVELQRPDVAELLGCDDERSVASESSSVVAARVASARSMAADRGVVANGQIVARDLDRLAPLDPEAMRVLETRLRQGRLSARGLHRIRRVARTLADLDGHPGPLEPAHAYAALALRADVFVPEAEAC